MIGQRTWRLLAATAVAGALAAPVAASPKLSLVPKVCVLASGEQLCRDRVNIEWYNDQPLTVCLFVKGTDSPLECWREEPSGDHQYQAETAESLLFQLRQRGSGTILASEVFAVIREHTQYRYRRRNPWSFF